MIKFNYANDIEITKGDTALFDVEIENYIFQQGDKAYISIKNPLNGEMLVKNESISYEGNLIKFSLSSEDTKQPVGLYKYDIQLNLSGNIVETVIFAKFKILGEVTI